MSTPPYRALRIVLRVCSFLVAFGSLLMIFAGKPAVVRIFLRPPEGEVSTLLLFLLKETGGFALMLSLLFWFAARDPVRNVAILDAVIAGLESKCRGSHKYCDGWNRVVNPVGGQIKNHGLLGLLNEGGNPPLHLGRQGANPTLDVGG